MPVGGSLKGGKKKIKYVACDVILEMQVFGFGSTLLRPRECWTALCTFAVVRDHRWRRTVSRPEVRVQSRNLDAHDYGIIVPVMTFALHPFFFHGSFLFFSAM
jgi:hypothetical protein